MLFLSYLQRVSFTIWNIHLSHTCHESTNPRVITLPIIPFFAISLKQCLGVLTYRTKLNLTAGRILTVPLQPILITFPVKSPENQIERRYATSNFSHATRRTDGWPRGINAARKNNFPPIRHVSPEYIPNTVACKNRHNLPSVRVCTHSFPREPLRHEGIPFTFHGRKSAPCVHYVTLWHPMGARAHDIAPMD